VLKFQANIILSVIKIGLFVQLFVVSCCNALALEESDRLVKIDTASDKKAGRIFLTVTNIMESTIHLYFEKLENAQTSQPVPYDFVIDAPCTNKTILEVKQKADAPWFYAFNYNYAYGLPSDLPTEDYIYSLPYDASEHFGCSQGPGGKFSHAMGSDEEHAVDFGMPSGTRVLASRAGKVIAFRDDSKVGGGSKKFKQRENFVIIKHDDGTYAAYVHLQHRGVFVKLGQEVSVGTPLGLSGSTGYATKPHLHFEVYRVKSGKSVPSLPFRMRTPRGIVTQMKEGEMY
jgi:murein DD-endopeptidase MepM/ murein hydrolase activator NlpD